MDHRTKGGLNNQKHPLQKIVEKRGEKGNENHILECGHILPQIGSGWVRWRRCYRCSGLEEKDKQMNEKIELMKHTANNIEFITGAAVGFPVALMIGRNRTGTGSEFQIMPEDEFKSGVEEFWDWHVENNEQWFATPLEAAADFVQKRQKFLEKKSAKVDF